MEYFYYYSWRRVGESRFPLSKEHQMAERRETDGLVDAPNPAAGNDNRRHPGSDIAKAHADFVMALAARKPCPIALEPHPEDFTARAILCEALIDGVKLHLIA